jgi:integrase
MRTLDVDVYLSSDRHRRLRGAWVATCTVDELTIRESAVRRRRHHQRRDAMAPDPRCLGIADDLTAHSFRKAGATFKDDAGLPTHIIADSLGQADILTTQRHYLARGKAHPEAPAVLDRMLEHPAN